MDRLRQRADFLAVANGARANAVAFVLQGRARDDDGDIHLVEGTIGATFRISIPDRPVELQSVRNERARA